ncbi:MAG TPA: hypothetical protein VIG94_03815 [Faecalibacter sp.]
MKEKLEKIWTKDYINSLPIIIKERGFNYSINEESKDILITGINPSFRIGAENGNSYFDFRLIAKDERYDTYWSSLKKIVYDKDLNINYLSRTAYLDIFYFRETDQNFLRNNILRNSKGLDFIIDQIKLTQEIIESIIKPKLIIVKNKESAAYWGKFAEKGIIWMGYKLELLQKYESGELYKICGLIESKERVYQELKKTNLENSLIFFTQHFQYAPKNKKPNATLTKEFLAIQESLNKTSH